MRARDARLELGGWGLALSLCLVGSLAAPVRGGEVIDRVLAVAAGDVIMLSDVTAARDLGLVTVAQTGDAVREALSQLIERSLILAEVDRYAPPDPTADAVAQELRLVRNRFTSDQAFEQALARSGLDDRRLAEILRQNLRVRAYLDQRFSAGGPDRRQALIDDWVAGLRRRAEVVDLYLAAP